MTEETTRRGTQTPSGAHSEAARHDLTDELTGAAAAGIGGATLGAAAGAAGGPVGAVVGGAVGAVIGAVAGGAAGAVVDIPGTDDLHGTGGGPLTDEEATLDHVTEIDSRDTLDPS